MLEMKREIPNPAGKAGKPFTLAPHSFEDALKMILKATPEPKPDKSKQPKKPQKNGRPRETKSLRRWL